MFIIALEEDFIKNVPSTSIGIVIQQLLEPTINIFVLTLIPMHVKMLDMAARF